MKDKILIISAINLVTGGPFSILIDCLEQISKSNICSDYRIIVLVHSKDQMPVYPNIEYYEYPLAKKNWFFRIFYEYIYFYFFSIKLKPQIWISLHDITPNVRSKYRYVYMHNPAPFFQEKKGIKVSFKFRLFLLFYKYIYKINVKRNTAVIVQQDWFRTKISELCKIPTEKIIVAYPEFSKDISYYDGDYNKNQFFFNAFPREFKNFETICEAANILNNSDLRNFNWSVYLTIDGSENVYSKQIVEKYKKNSHLHFIGLISREKCEEYYKSSEALIFPSLLETWGLPISEFKLYNKKMILADLPYAHEAAGGACKVCFFNPRDAELLADVMQAVVKENDEYFKTVPIKRIQSPYCVSWTVLFEHIIKE